MILAETAELLEQRPQHDDSRNESRPATLHTLGILLEEPLASGAL